QKSISSESACGCCVLVAGAFGFWVCETIPRPSRGLPLMKNRSLAWQGNAMARTMIEIEPGSESWDAWIEYHKGSKTELVMVKCRHDARPFYAWSEFPPERARADGLSSTAAKAGPAKIERSFNVEGDVEGIAERLEARAARDEAEVAAKSSRA